MAGHHQQHRQHREEAEVHAIQLRALCIAMIIIPTIAVALRFWSRLMRTGTDNGLSLRVGLWWDDWVVLACLVR